MFFFITVIEVYGKSINFNNKNWGLYFMFPPI